MRVNLDTAPTDEGRCEDRHRNGGWRCTRLAHEDARHEYDVRVYHNTEHLAMLDGYQTTHTLILVAALDPERLPTRSEHAHLAICEDIYRLFNVGDDPHMGQPDERAIAYRHHRNRSLSIGDVIAIPGETDYWYACMPVGFMQIQPPTLFSSESVRGSTFLGAWACC